MQRTMHALLAAVAAALVLLPFATPASGEVDGHEAGVSLDGTRYRATLEGPLFADEVTWTPGQARVSRFWARGGAGRSDLSIGLEVAEASGLVEDGSLRVAARTGDGPWRPVRPDRALLLTDAPARTGVRVSVRVLLTDDAPAGTTLRGSDLAIGVTLDGAHVAGTAPAVDEPLPVGPGEAATWWVVPLGLVLLSVGAFWFGRREAGVAGA